MLNSDKNKKLSVKGYRSKIISGFTFLEILMVIGIIGILATVMVVIVNPARQLAKARDTQRDSDIYSYLASLPKDPKTGTDENTGYLIMVDGYNHLTASASGETKTISLTK